MPPVLQRGRALPSPSLFHTVSRPAAAIGHTCPLRFSAACSKNITRVRTLGNIRARYRVNFVNFGARPYPRSRPSKNAKNRGTRPFRAIHSLYAT